MPDLSVPGCPFCGTEKSRLLCENRLFFARFDPYPATPGHVEIVPKRHVDSLFDLSWREAWSAWRLLRKARRLLLDAEFWPDGFNVGVNDGRAAGRTVHHLHIHLIPRRYGDVPDPRGGIRRGLPNGDPDTWTASTKGADRG